MGQFTWHPKKKLIRLKLHPETKDLYGEVAAARLSALASAMEAEVEVR